MTNTVVVKPNVTTVETTTEENSVVLKPVENTVTTNETINSITVKETPVAVDVKITNNSVVIKESAGNAIELSTPYHKTVYSGAGFRYISDGSNQASAASVTDVFTISATSPLSATVNPGTKTATFTVPLASGATDGLMTSADFTKLAGLSQYTHPVHPGDDIDIDTTLLSGATVISDLDLNVETDTEGHVIDANGVVATRVLTLGDLGFTGDANANNYTHPTGDGNLHVPATSTTNNGRYLTAGPTAGSLSWTVPVQSDWNSSTGASQILNKPNVQYTSPIPQGNAGLVPNQGTSGQFLSYNGTWATPPDNDTQYSLATNSTDGLLSSSDYTKLSNIASNAEVNVNADWNSNSGDSEILNKPNVQYTSPIPAGNNGLVPAAGTSGQYLQYDGTWSTPPGYNVPVFTTSANGLVPLSGANTSKYLKGDGTWDTPTDTIPTAINVASVGAVMDSDFGANGFMKRTGAGTYTVDQNTYITGISSFGIHDLSDVIANTQGSGDVLTWQSNNWQPQSTADWDTAYTHSQSAHAPASAEANVQADWNQSLINDDSYIKNKPTIPGVLGDLGNVSSSAPSNTQVLTWNGSQWEPQTSPTGTTIFTGLTDTPGGYTTHGNKFVKVNSSATALEFGPTDNSSNWDTAYGWGDHASAGYLTSFTETNDLSASVTWANIPDANVPSSAVTQHQASLSITKSQVSDLTTGDLDLGSNKVLFGNMYANLVDLPNATTYHGMFAHVHATGKAYFAHGGNWVELANNSQTANSANWDTAYGWGDHASGGYQASSALNGDIDTHLNQSGATTNDVLSWNGSDYAWVAQSGGGSYGDSDVDTHLNTGSASANQILSWNGSDYAWVADQTGSGGTGGGITTGKAIAMAMVFG